MPNILIIDRDIEFAIRFMNKICQENLEVRVVGIVRTKNEALEIMKENFYLDVVLINEKFEDGSTYLDVLKQIKHLSRYRRTCIVVCEERKRIKYHECIYSCAFKGYDDMNVIDEVNALIKFIGNNRLNLENLHDRVMREVVKLGFDTTYKGTQYIMTAVEYMISNSFKNIDRLETCVYPMLSEYYRNDIHNIKCNILRSITMMYYNCDSDRLQRYFCLSGDVKPKVKLVLNTIVNRVG